MMKVQPYYLAMAIVILTHPANKHDCLVRYGLKCEGTSTQCDEYTCLLQSMPWLRHDYNVILLHLMWYLGSFRNITFLW